MSETNKPHGHFVRKALSYRELAVPFFSRHLPTAISEVVDLERIQTVRESFIDRELAELI